jgi:hypothetical protein
MPDFTKIFIVECDASGHGIDVVFSVLKTGESEPEPIGFTGLMVDWFKPAGLVPNRPVSS